MSITHPIRCRPINLTAHEVLAILAGRQMQLRRPADLHTGDGCRYRLHNGVVQAFIGDFDNEPETSDDAWMMVQDGWERGLSCPHGFVGNQLWGRETLRERGGVWRYGADGAPVQPQAKDHHLVAAWCHHQERDYCVSIHMPRWSSRITLEIADVRLQRVQEISEADALADGGWTYAKCPIHKSPVRSFADLWESRHGSNYWNSNPWVWALTFRRVLA